MEWEVRLTEWLQSNSGSFTLALGKFFSFIGGENGLLLGSLIVLFCWNKESGKRLALSGYKMGSKITKNDLNAECNSCGHKWHQGK